MSTLTYVKLSVRQKHATSSFVANYAKTTSIPQPNLYHFKTCDYWAIKLNLTSSLYHICVSFKMDTLSTFHVTHTTFVWSFISMCKYVSYKMATFSKLLMTDVTSVWPFTSMCKHVRIKMATVTKLLVTHITFMCPCTLR